MPVAAGRPVDLAVGMVFDVFASAAAADGVDVAFGGAGVGATGVCDVLVAAPWSMGVALVVALDVDPTSVSLAALAACAAVRASDVDPVTPDRAGEGDDCSARLASAVPLGVPASTVADPPERAAAIWDASGVTGAVVEAAGNQRGRTSARDHPRHDGRRQVELPAFIDALGLEPLSRTIGHIAGDAAPPVAPASARFSLADSAARSESPGLPDRVQAFVTCA